MSKVEDFWSDFYSTESGGGGVICLATIQTGYKVYAGGFTGNQQEKTFFPAPPGKDNPEREEIKNTKVMPFAEKHPGEIRFGILIHQRREGANLATGELVGWNFDQFKFFAHYTDAMKKVLMPSLTEHGIAAPLAQSHEWKGWVRLGFVDDPYKVRTGKTRMRPDGTETYSQVPYITEVFPNEAAAHAALGSSKAASSGSGSDLPEGWDEATWRSIWSELYKARESGKGLPDIAKECGVSVKSVVAALNEYIPF